MNIRNFSLFLLLACISALFAGCSSSGSGSGTGTVTSVSVKIQASTRAAGAALASTVDSIASISVDVQNGTSTLISGQSLTYSNGTWSGTLENLPVGPVLTFTAHAYDASSAEIFTGNTSQAMTGSGDQVSITLTPVSSGSAALPAIIQIICSDQLAASNDAMIFVTVSANAGDTLSYAITAAPGGGAFTPSNGSMTLSGAEGTFAVTYTAPASTGTYTHSIRVTDQDGNWVETQFTTLVVYTAASGSLSVKFAPVITAIGARRSGSNLQFSAEVNTSGQPGTIAYAWGFDGGLSFADNTQNPATLQGYDQTQSGNLTVSASNNVGTTTASYYLAAGKYPDTVQVSSLSVTFQPATIATTAVAGDSMPLGFTAIPNLQTDTFIVSLTGGTGVFNAGPSVTVNPDGSYTGSLSVSSGLAAGTYQGSLYLSLCLDAACTMQLPGSPAILPYEIHVASTSNLAPLSSWPGVQDWGMYQGNAAHTGYLPVTLDAAAFTPRWTWTNPDSTTVSRSVEANGLVYVTTSGYFATSSKLYAIKETDASTQWQYDFGGLYAAHPPAVRNGTVYVATTTSSEKPYMWSFPAATGSPIGFTTAFSSQWDHYYAPTVDDSAVYTDGGSYGGAYAFNIADGSQKWFASLSQYDQWTPAVDDAYVYAYTGGGTGLSILSKTTGTLVARIADPYYNWNGYSIYGAPVIGSNNDVLAVNGARSSGGNNLLNFSVTNQNIAWQQAGTYATNPALANGIVYAVNNSPVRLEARSEASGSLLWSWTPSGSGETSFVGDVVVTDNIVFASTNKRIYAIDLAGHVPVWSWNKPGSASLSANGVLYIVSSDGKSIVAVNVK